MFFSDKIPCADTKKDRASNKFILWKIPYLSARRSLEDIFDVSPFEASSASMRLGERCRNNETLSNSYRLIYLSVLLKKIINTRVALLLYRYSAMRAERKMQISLGCLWLDVHYYRRICWYSPTSGARANSSQRCSRNIHRSARRSNEKLYFSLPISVVYRLRCFIDVPCDVHQKSEEFASVKNREWVH